MPISRDEVIWAYRMFLGREAESEDAIRHNMKCNSRLALREQMARCPEFLATGLCEVQDFPNRFNMALFALSMGI